MTLPIVGEALGSPVVELSVNGTGPYKFRFDSASGELVDRRIADAATLKPTSSTRLVEINRTDVRADVSDDVSIEANGARLNGVSLVLMPPDWPGAEGADGVVGQAMLGRFSVTLDIPHRRLTLTRPDRFVPPRGATVLPMRWNTGSYQVRACVDGNCGWFAIDTGLNQDVALLPSFLKAEAVRRRYPQVGDVAMLSGQSGHKSSARGVFGKVLQIGNFQLAEPAVVLLNEAADEANDPDVAGLIGTSALASLEVTFDAAHNRLILRRVAADLREHHGRGFDVEYRQGVTLVRDVIRDGPAWKAGLRDGDVVVAIDGKPIDSLPPGLWDGFWSRSDGTPDQIQFKHQGRVLTRTLLSGPWRIEPYG